MILPYPPSVNSLYSNRPGKGRVKSYDYRVWIEQAGRILKTFKPAPVTGKVSVSISILRPDKRKRDIDNLAKAILDLLVKHRVIEDDRHIESLLIAWRHDGPRGAIVEVAKA